MKNFTPSTGISVSVAAAAMSIVCALFVPYGYPWPSLAWAVLACAAAVWVAKSSDQRTLSMSDVIREVEAESAPAPAPAVAVRGVASKRAVL